MMCRPPGDHEGGEVGGVDGEEHHGEERPDGGHEAGGEAAGAVHLSSQCAVQQCSSLTWTEAWKRTAQTSQ